MKTYLKRLRFSLVIIFFGVVGIIMISCQKTQENLSIDVIKPLGVATLSDFENVGVVLTKQQTDELSKESLIGITPETALVPLIFDLDGRIYTPEKYARDFDAIMDGRIKPALYYTDLITFKKVTNFSYATPDYVLDMSDEKGHHYVLDYLRKEQIPTIERQNIVNQKQSINNSMKKVSTATTPFKSCDVLVGKWTTGGSYGHACVVYTEATVSSTNINTFINATTTFDAWEASANPANDIGFHNMSTYWASSNIQYRYLLKPVIALTTAQKTIIKNYLVNQDGDTYSWSTTLNTEDQWYCSKLVWKAYKQIGRDIGRNPTIFVTPMDIAGDSDMAGSSF